MRNLNSKLMSVFVVGFVLLLFFGFVNLTFAAGSQILETSKLEVKEVTKEHVANIMEKYSTDFSVVSVKSSTPINVIPIQVQSLEELDTIMRGIYSEENNYFSQLNKPNLFRVSSWTKTFTETFNAGLGGIKLQTSITKGASSIRINDTWTTGMSTVN